MKKFLVVLMAIVSLSFISCTKDSPVAKSLYQNSAVIEGVTYELNIAHQGEDYTWSNLNKTDEVTFKYVFNYERKSDLVKDFAALAEGLDAIDGSLIPVFAHEFRFGGDQEHDGVISRVVEGGNVFVRFDIGPRTFRLPYAFVVEAYEAIKPKE